MSVKMWAVLSCLLMVSCSFGQPAAGAGDEGAPSPRASYHYMDYGQDFTLSFTCNAPSTVHWGFLANVSGTATVTGSYKVSAIKLHWKGLDSSYDMDSAISAGAWSSPFWVSPGSAQSPGSLEFIITIVVAGTSYGAYNVYYSSTGLSNLTPSDTSYIKITASMPDPPTVTHTPPAGPTDPGYWNTTLIAHVSDSAFVKLVQVYVYQPASESWRWYAEMQPVPGTEVLVHDFDSFYNPFTRSADYSCNLWMDDGVDTLWYLIIATEAGNVNSSAPSIPSVVSKYADQTEFPATTQERDAAYKLVRGNGTPPEPELTITHEPLLQMRLNTTGNVTADIVSDDPVSVELFYKGIGESAFSSVAMTAGRASSATYRARIPGQSKSGEVDYYLKASTAKKTATSPDGAPANFHKVNVAGDFRVVDHYPQNGDINLPIDMGTTARPSITVTFSEDASSTFISSNTLSIYYFDNTLGKHIIPADVTYSSNSFTARIVPSKLPHGEKLFVLADAVISNKARTATLGRDYVFSFTTMPEVTVRVAAVQACEEADLVEGKPVVVRVFAEWPLLQGYNVKQLDSKGILKLDGKEVGRLDGKDFKPLRVLSNGSRMRGDYSANIYNLKFADVTGTYKLEATVEPVIQHTATPQSFNNTTTVRVRTLNVGNLARFWHYDIRYFPLGCEEYLRYQINCETFDTAKVASSWDAYLESIFPVDRTRPSFDGTVYSESWFAMGFPDGDSRLAAQLYALHKNAQFRKYQKYVAIVPSGFLSSRMPGTVGLSKYPFTSAVLVEEGAQPTVMAHEILHTYGIEHDSAVWDLKGFDVKGKALRSNNERSGYFQNVMSPTPGPAELSWLGSMTYNSLAAQFSTAPGRASGQNRSILISGRLGPQATLFPAYLLDVPPDPSVPTGNATVKLLDTSGTVLASYNVATGDIGGSPYFAFRAALPDGLASVVLSSGGTDVARLSKSAGSPSVSLKAPSGVVSGGITLNWTGTDTDGDNLTYTVLYSSDGVEWNVLVSDINTTSYSFSADGLPGKSLTFRVMASDGLNNGLADSAPVSVADRAPTLVIIHPSASEALATYPAGENTTFEARACDAEDGLLSGTQVSWSSDIQGILGTGDVLSIPLTKGRHRITATATDSGGKAGTATILIVVGDSEQEPPVVPPPVESHYIVLQASPLTVTNGKVTLSWFGSFPQKGSVMLFSQEGPKGQWKAAKTITGFTQTSTVITGLSTSKKIIYTFIAGIVAENGTVLEWSDTVEVTTKLKSTPPSGPCLVLPMICIASIGAIGFGTRRRKRPSGWDPADLQHNL
jgi:hypothetical protein